LKENTGVINFAHKKGNRLGEDNRNKK